MGELILCRQSIAANPYFIEDGALNVYSMVKRSLEGFIRMMCWS